MSNSSRAVARVDPDSRGVLYLLLGVTSLLAAVSFVVSFAGLAAVAEWAALPTWLSWALPIFIDGAIVVYTMAMLVFRARGESTAFAWVVLLGFTAVSVGANAAHAYAEGTTGDWRTLVGTGLAGLAPAGVALAVHTLARLIVEPPTVDHASATAVTATETTALEPESPSPDPGGLPVVTDPAPTVELDRPESRNGRVTERPTPATEAEQPAAAPAVPVHSQEDDEQQPSPERAVTLREQGWSLREIGDECGVSKTTVSRWLKAAKDKPAHSADAEWALRAVG